MKLNMEQVNTLRKQDPTANAIISAWLERKRDKKATDIYQFRRAKLSNIPAKDVVSRFMQFSQMGFGKFIPANGTVPPKFRWAVKAGDFKKRSEGNAVAKPQPSTPAQQIYTLISFRDGFLRLALPSDITQNELQSLAKALENVPTQG